jgi:2-succinyl-5-enolpyruvyl-6-hydroxy-3-cyclohexene-1-carboxylate synthase
MSRDANTSFAATVVDEWARAGVSDVCVAPGSRNAPLTLALAEQDRLRVHVHVDERSAAFFALGCARGSGRPAVVCCTSGTAAAHLHPAVLEASHAGVPLIVCTADRPPELRDTGAGQTIDQVGLFGGVLRWHCDVDAPADRAGVGAWWRSGAARSVAAATGPPAGPVHLNVAFRDPLAPTGEPLVDAPGRADGRAWTVTVPPQRRLDAAAIRDLATRIRRAERGVLVAGPGADVAPELLDAFASAAGWPVLADPLSGLRRGDHACATYDALLRDAGFAARHLPDLVVRIGAPSRTDGWPTRRSRGSSTRTVAGSTLPAVPAIALSPTRPRCSRTWLVRWPSQTVTAPGSRTGASRTGEPGGRSTSSWPARRSRSRVGSHAT